MSAPEFAAEPAIESDVQSTACAPRTQQAPIATCLEDPDFVRRHRIVRATAAGSERVEGRVSPLTGMDFEAIFASVRAGAVFESPEQS